MGKSGTGVLTGNPWLPGVTLMTQGCNFTVEAPLGAEVSLLLYPLHSQKPCREIPITDEYRIGRIRSIFLPGFDFQKHAYNYLIDGKVCVDPAAGIVYGREKFGLAPKEDPHALRGGFIGRAWGNCPVSKGPEIPYRDMILYKVHVRGYTKANRELGAHRGTFKGLIDMIPYFRELGINALELMPAYEFDEVLSGKAPDPGNRVAEKKPVREQVNFWGYGNGFYFAPKRSYCAGDDPRSEFLELVRALHGAGICLIMEFFFGPEMSAAQVLEVLHFWKSCYGVDGFHISGEDHTSLLVRDGMLADTKIMTVSCDKDLPVTDPSQICYADYNNGFLEDMRRFLKSDPGMLQAAKSRLISSRSDRAHIAYMACQDGFTLMDAVSYNNRHNEENGENNEDGPAANYSWNCGVEGPTRKKSVLALRLSQRRNALAMVLLSQCVPMIYGGDEFGNSQGGNNNAWCQDNAQGWVDWKAKERNGGLLSFVKACIAFRKSHPLLLADSGSSPSAYQGKGFPVVSFHGERAWYLSEDPEQRLLGIMYSGSSRGLKGAKEQLYIACNFHWESRRAALPALSGASWRKVMDTSDLAGNGFMDPKESPEEKKAVLVPPRSIVVLAGCQKEEGEDKDASLSPDQTL